MNTEDVVLKQVAPARVTLHTEETASPRRAWQNVAAALDAGRPVGLQHGLGSAKAAWSMCAPVKPSTVCTVRRRYTPSARPCT